MKKYSTSWAINSEKMWSFECEMKLSEMLPKNSKSKNLAYINSHN